MAANWDATAEAKVPCPTCGCTVALVVVTRAEGRPRLDAPVPAEPVTSKAVRCNAPRTPNGVRRCYFDRGHTGPHSWEPKP